jgi:hypothetical protein
MEQNQAKLKNMVDNHCGGDILSMVFTTLVDNRLIRER